MVGIDTAGGVTRMLAEHYQLTGYVYAGPQAAFRHTEQTLDHPTLIAIEAGEFEFEMGQTAGQAALGDLVFCPAGVSFKRRALSSITFHHIHFEEIKRDLAGCPFPLGKIMIQDVIRLSSTYHYLRHLAHLTNNPDIRFRLMRQYVVPDLLLLTELELLQHKRRHKTNDLLMQQAFRYLQTHACRPFSMKQLAADLGMSPSQLTRRFQSAYGVGPAAYVTTLRLEEAKRLLLETEDTLEAIAFQCGYESGSYLCRIFTAKTGLNPSLFRQKYRI
ncbi:AraC family transcriptional regulator [Paenibacillus sp. GD4]|jgi:AraC family transcriptional regulator|uniref:helix-turn-helix domain-containing protein n=1 Tax=Paenibacillus sp. GD4 TaxID=3068890 RepID=UPI002796BDE7|nr:AraC family transcriptional regulator [Paenibacillus sp. GD4]MDQ1912679.1 AraC family transcriptional regulator [Paenibacillus sp. GD4]